MKPHKVDPPGGKTEVTSVTSDLTVMLLSEDAVSEWVRKRSVSYVLFLRKSQSIILQKVDAGNRRKIQRKESYKEE